MSAYTVTCDREGDWWVLRVHNVGATQCRTMADADRTVRDLIEQMTGDTRPRINWQATP